MKVLLAVSALVLIVMAWINRREVTVLAGQIKTRSLHPEVKKRVDKIISEANAHFKQYNLQVAVFEGVRSIDRQEDVIASGNSFLTNALRSYHVWGLAVDIVFLDKKGNWTWYPVAECEDGFLGRFLCPSTDTLWQQLGGFIEKYDFEWGGRWRTFDGAHAQYTRLGRTNHFIERYQRPENWFASAEFQNAELA